DPPDLQRGRDAVRRRAPDRAGAVGRLAGGRLPRHPDGVVRPADGRPRPARGDAPQGAARRPAAGRAAAGLPPRRRPMFVTWLFVIWPASGRNDDGATPRGVAPSPVCRPTDHTVKRLT